MDDAGEKTDTKRYAELLARMIAEASQLVGLAQDDDRRVRAKAELVVAMRNAMSHEDAIVWLMTLISDVAAIQILISSGAGEEEVAQAMVRLVKDSQEALGDGRQILEYLYANK